MSQNTNRAENGAGGVLAPAVPKQGSEQMRAAVRASELAAAAHEARQAELRAANRRVDGLFAAGVLWDAPQMATAVARRRAAAGAAEVASREAADAAAAVHAEMLVAAAI